MTRLLGAFGELLTLWASSLGSFGSLQDQPMTFAIEYTMTTKLAPVLVFTLPTGYTL